MPRVLLDAAGRPRSPSIYLQGIDSTEIIDTVHARRPPTVPVDAMLRL